MPIFEYICQECQHEFEILVFGRDKAACPKCRSKKLSPQLSVFAVSAKGSAGVAGFHGSVRRVRRPPRSRRLLAR
jgi:putative FmdB family regulatory protein